MVIAVSFPTGVISVAKALLLLGGVLVLAWEALSRPSPRVWPSRIWTAWAIGLALAWLAASALWGTAVGGEALHAWSKHAKLAMLVLLIAMVRSRGHALIVLRCFLGMQAFILLASWLQVFHVPMPFPTQSTPGRDYLVFAGHLDQPIMMAASAAVFWHLRVALGFVGRRAQGIALAIIGLVALNLFVVQFGRTGHLVALALVAAAVFWAIPHRYKLVAFLSPVVVAGAIVASSPQVEQRMVVVWQEVSQYQNAGDIASSSGERLNYWRRSLQAIEQSPWAGYGVGSWNVQYNRMEGGKGRFHTYQIRNPHQEFLLWTVEAGLLGLALLCAVLAAVWVDSRNMSAPAQYATRSVLLACVVACLFNSALFDTQIGDFLCAALGITLAWGLAHD